MNDIPIDYLDIYHVPFPEPPHTEKHSFQYWEFFPSVLKEGRSF